MSEIKCIGFKWEYIKDQRHMSCTHRSKVIGGWVLHSLVGEGGNKSQSESMVFIPDPNHEWII